MGGGGIRAPLVAAAAVKRIKQTSMDQFTTQGTCTLCENDSVLKKSLCAHCLYVNQLQTSFSLLYSRLNLAVAVEAALADKCVICTQRRPQHAALFAKDEMIGPDSCESLDCDVFFNRCRAVTRIEDLTTAVADIEDLTAAAEPHHH